MKNMITSLLIIFGLAGFVGSVLPSRVVAVDVLNPVCEDHADASACRDNTNQSTSGNAIYGPDGVLTKVASLIAVIVGIASVFMIIVGGFKYITSSGDPGNAKSAKDTILYAVVGILVALAAQSIVVFVLSRL